MKARKRKPSQPRALRSSTALARSGRRESTSFLKGTRRLATDVAALIDSAREQLGRAANAALTTLYWQIGSRIRKDVLKQRRAEYGAEIVADLGKRLE